MLPFGQLGERLTLDDDVANLRLHHHVHLEEGFHGLAFVEGMVLEFLVGGESGCGEFGVQSLLVDVFRETCSKLFVHLEDAADDVIGVSAELLGEVGVCRLELMYGIVGHVVGGFDSVS